MINDYFDSDYSEYMDIIEKILSPLCFIGFGIPLLGMYWVFIKKPITIYPFGIGNYIHAQYENIINESKEQENRTKYNQWNYPRCEVI